MNTMLNNVDKNNLKALEMEKRIRRLEHLVDFPMFNYYYARKNSTIVKPVHIFRYNFVCHSEGYLKLLARIDCDSYTPIATYYINGVVAKVEQFYHGLPDFEGVFPFHEGKNEVVLKIESVKGFKVNNVIFETFGNIGYGNEDYILSCINEIDKSVVMFICDNSLNVKIYNGKHFDDYIIKDNIKGGAMCKFKDGYLLALIDVDNKLKFEKYDANLNLISEKISKVNAISICAFSGINPVLYAIIGNRLYKIAISDSLDIKAEATKYYGKKVISNPSVAGCIILVDFDGNGKLISL